ncbi:MAG: UDP-N-acetylmuramoyl-L-alanine--D-glutamate ligase [Polyangia bacterium]
MMRTVVIGAGKTGLAVARRLLADGDEVTLSDKRAELERFSAPRLTWELGGHQVKTLLAADRIVLSPGVPSFPALETARRAGVAITGEIELATHRISAPIVGITGTNGKSTVTALCGAIAEATGRPSFTGGNLGTPLIDVVGTPAASVEGLCIVELSSYQLETFEHAHPRAAALLNLTPDHLDRYGSMEGYGDAKMKIARNMSGDDVLVISGEDAEVARALERNPVRCRVLRFGLDAGDACIEGDDYVLRLAHEERYPRSLSRLAGRHNDRNVLAALLLLRACNIASRDAVRLGLAGFRALPHRMELVAERGGVRFYDDSKATNVDSVVAGVDGFPVPFTLIAGGRDKGGSYAPLVDALLRGPCRGIVTIGEAAPLIEAAVGERLQVARAATLPDAVRTAREWMKAGEAVILSPACSSFDMFRDYAERGAVFKQSALDQP